jgi:glycosyltransferase involved in cell wall biosynthesis
MKYSVVIPVYNSEASLKELFEKLQLTLTSLSEDFEVIFIDDYSKDNSWNVLNELKNSHPSKVKIVRFAKNYGQHNATFCGLKHASGDFVLTIDDDLQYNPEDIKLLVDEINKTQLDVVYGVGTQGHSNLRKVGSEIYKRGTKFFEKSLGDGSSFRIIRSQVIQNIVGHEQHFIFIDEFLQWYTHNIGFITVEHKKREKGKTGYSPLKIIKMLSETTYNYGTWPLKLMIYGGAILSLFTFLLGVYFIYKKLFLNVSVPGFTAIIVAVLFSTSVMLMCFGVIGNYLKNIYSVLNKKPSYTIKESHL